MCEEATVRNVTWPQVVLLSVISVSLLAAVTVLALAGRDVGAILSAISAFLVLIIGAMGFSQSQKISTQMNEVKEQGNGRLEQLMEDNKRLHEQVTALALSHKPPQESS
jgi:membrane protein implicated in regulation of membrane protease activity